jgi:ketosteroid isomerase-like protein
MKHIFLTVVLLIVLPVLAISQTNGKNANQKGDEQAVRQTINDLSAALERSDVAALDRLYADDYIVTNENGATQSKAERVAAIKSGALKFESVSFSDITVRVYDDAAVARFRSTSKVQSAGTQPLGGDLRVTVTLVKTKWRWQVVAAHVTRIAGQ